jgi:4-amino-4-deoxy-L-arabinose transferase-like glycosyltransferase
VIPDRSDPDRRPTPRARFAVLAALLVLAALVKGKYQLDYHAREPLADAPYGDSLVYLDEVERHFHGEVDDPYYKPPAYTALLALFDAETPEGRVRTRVLQSIFGLFTLLFVFLLAEARGGLLAGSIAFLLALGYAPLSYHESKLLDTTAAICITAFGIWQLDRSLRSGVRARDAFLVGLVFGVGALVRGANLVLGICVAGVFLLARARHPTVPPWTGRWVHAFCCLAAVALPIVPITLHNHRACDEWIAVNYSEGHTVLTGNNPNAFGMFSLPPNYPDGVWNERAVEFEIAKRALGRDPSPTEQRDSSYAAAWRFLRENPDRALDLFANKARFAVASRPLGDNDSVIRERERFGLLPGLGVVFPWILAPALAMLALRRSRPTLPIALPLGFALLALFLAFVNERYRCAAVPYLAVGASLLPVALLDRLRGETQGRISFALFLGGLPFIVLLARPLPVTEEQLDRSEQVFSVILDLHAANSIRAQGDLERAAAVLGAGIADHADVAESVALDGALAELLRTSPSSQRESIARAARDGGRDHPRVAVVVR